MATATTLLIGSSRSKGQLQVSAFALIGLVAAADYAVSANVSLGLLYVIPMALLGGCSGRSLLISATVGCALLHELFAPFAGDPGWAIRIPVTFAMFGLVGLLSMETLRQSIVESRFVSLNTEHRFMREVAQAQLSGIVETTSPGVVSVNGAGRVLLANTSAGRLLGHDVDTILTKCGSDLVPTIAHQINQVFADDTAVQESCSTVIRSDGYHVRCRFRTSRHRSADGMALTCVFADESPELRTRETEMTDWLSRTSDLVINAATHEVRNLASAVAISLESPTALSGPSAFSSSRTAASFIGRIHEIAFDGLRSKEIWGEGTVSVAEVYDDLLVILEPICEHQRIWLVWDHPYPLPTVYGDHHSLLQVILNLVRNSVQALSAARDRVITIRTRTSGGRPAIWVSDLGPGVERPELLFKAYSEEAAGSGLGLFISRAFAQGWGGDLTYQSIRGCGATFRVNLSKAEGTNEDA